MLEGGGEGDGQGKEQGRPGLVDGRQQGGDVLGRTSDEEEAGSRASVAAAAIFAALKNRERSERRTVAGLVELDPEGSRGGD